jgi:predicted oxidoreductase
LVPPKPTRGEKTSSPGGISTSSRAASPPPGGGRLVDGSHPAAQALAEHGKLFGVDAATTALAWAMAHPARILPIIGSQTPTRIRASADVYKVDRTRAAWYDVLQAGMAERLR